MDKTYDPKQIEQRWYAQWEEKGDFKPSGKGNPYCIMIPPPNVTGTLHMGHGFQQTLMDTLIRYHRMKGDNTLWQVGCDHAGIATQMVVERQLQQEGTSRLELGREPFLERVKAWKETSGNTIMKQIRRLGCSVDWEHERFTMDDAFCEAVTEVFIQLYDEDLIYRGQRLVNWDPVLLTAISDLEVVSEEEPAQLWHIRYPLVNSKDFLVVATTRPETLFGDTAVAVHPEDPRYKHFIGHYIHLPLTDRTIPVIADTYVDPAFGTGCVKITPAHDFNDYQVGKRHSLPMINIFTPDAKLNVHVPPAYEGMDRYVAREAVVAALTKEHLLEKTENHTMTVPRGDRSGSVIEPYLTDQWFVRAKPLAEPAIAAVEEGRITFTPDTWNKTYFQWLHHIEDWCISRQLWWGHRIPAWYDATGHVYVAATEEKAREKYQLSATLPLTQDEDVLDTWFSSALWPFVTLGWPHTTERLQTFYPTQTLMTGFDILFFWVARMVMLGLKFMGTVPFEKVYITGLIRDSEGQKMSKSKGNILDPIDLIDGIDLKSLIEKRTQSLLQPAMAKKIEKTTRQLFPEGIAPYGTDALRLTFCMLASTGRNIRFDISRLAGYRNFCNKLWNATRYVLMNTEEKFSIGSPLPLKLSLADTWILSELQKTITTALKHFDEFRFDLLAQCLYEFTWHEFCDWYLELSKPILTDHGSPEEQQGTRWTLLTTLETILRLLHPIMPFITEEMWQRVAPLLGLQGNSISHQPYPTPDESKADDKASYSIEWLKKVILAIRTIRGEMNISPGKPLDVLFHKGTPEDKKQLTLHETFLMNLAKLKSITWIEGEKLPPAASALAGDLEILIPMADLIDKEAELIRLQKEYSKAEKEFQQLKIRLENPNFVARAPQAVVEKEQKALQEATQALEKIQEHLSRIQAL